MAVLEKPFFPPLLARCSKHWKGIFPKLNHYTEELVFFINHQTWKILQRKWSGVALTKNKKRWRKLVLHAAQWSTANYPVVHGELPSGLQQTQSQNDLRRRQLQQDDEEDEAMAEKTKKSTMAAQINTSWNKKWWKASWSFPLSTGHGGLRHRVVYSIISWNKSNN